MALEAIAQPADSTVVKGQSGFWALFEEPSGLKPSPRKAFALSLVVPGAGQVYNQKQWYIRAPIAAGLVGGGVYLYVDARQEYVRYRDALRDRAQGIETEFDSNPLATDARLREIRGAYQQRMEQALFGTLIVHLLQGIEAFSTAHLLNFNISDDLSLELEPHWEAAPPYNGAAMGIQASFTF